MDQNQEGQEEGAITEADAEAALEQGVADGHLEHAGVDANGKPTYRLTAAGNRYVEEELLPAELVAAVKRGDRDVTSTPAKEPRDPLALRLPPQFHMSSSTTLYYSGKPEEGIGVEVLGGSLAWLDAADAIALARGILARLEPKALVPRELSPGAILRDVSRAELVAIARTIVAESPAHRQPDVLAAYAGGLLEGVNDSLEQLGYPPATVEELLP